MNSTLQMQQMINGQTDSLVWHAVKTHRESHLIASQQ